MLSPTATQNPISAHFPTAFALMGVEFCHDRYRIRPTSGMRNDRMFRPVEGLSTSTFLLATAQPQEGQMTALSSTSLPQLLQYFILFSLSGEVFSPAFLFLQQFYEIDSHILGCSFTLGIIFTPYTDYPLFNHFLNIRFYHYLHQPSFSPVARNPTSPYQKSACRTPQQADSGSISYVSIFLWLPFPHGYGVPTY